jgi:hypothetical protein
MPVAKLYNLARMTTVTTGTGTLALGAAAPSFLSFAQAGVQDGDTVTYAIEDGANREIGRGVYGAAGATLTRAVLKSTNGDAPINLSGGAQVFITAAAQDFPIAAAGAANFLPKWDGNAALTGMSLTSDDGSKVQINTNSAPPPAALGAPFNVVQSDGAFNRVGLDSFGERCGVARRRANGTNASKTALQANDIIGVDQYFGYGTTGYSANRRAEIGSIATENWADLAQGCAIYFATNPNGVAGSAVERLRIDQDGSLVHRNQATVLVDVNSFIGLRSFTVGTLPSASTAARLIYVSDGTGNKRLAVSDGTNWRWPDGSIIS